MKRLLIVALAVPIVLAFVLAPPPARRLALAAGEAPIVRGAYHVHTRRSDGTGTVESVAAAAKRAGLQFVIFTDHGDGTGFDSPRYVDGVLCIDAVEVSTDDGHVVALGIQRAAFPLGGDAESVVEDIARLGGAAIAAHPASPKAELQWRDWNAAIAGVEWLNGDSEWRDESPATLLRTLFTYPVRAAETLATVLDRPAVMERWDAIAQSRQLFGIAAHDAHARLGLRDEGDRDGSAAALPLPSYEASFRALSVNIPRQHLSGDALLDARSIHSAIVQGSSYSAIDAIATPAAVSFTADQGPLGDPVTFRVASNAPVDAQITLLRNGREVAQATGPALVHESPGTAGAYRVEIALPDAPGTPPVPWVVTSPIYIGVQSKGPDLHDPIPPPPSSVSTVVYESGLPPGWTIENSPRSLGALDVTKTSGGTELALRYALGGGRSESPFVALVAPAAGTIAGHDRVTFTARASAPMRISVQLRVPGGQQGERWHRTVYLHPGQRVVTLFFNQMKPRGATSTPRAPLSRVRDLMFVVDSVNTRPGIGGQIWIDDVTFERE